MICNYDRVTVLIKSKMTEEETSENLKGNNKMFGFF